MSAHQDRAGPLAADNDTFSQDEPFLNLIIKYMESEGDNQTKVDFRQPFIKNSLKYVYPLFIFLHALVCLFGTFGNATLLVVIVRRRLYRVPTFFFLANLALADMIKASIVLPITVTTMLFANWIFGSFLCFFLPMMHSFPIHASMLTYTLIAVDRYRLIVHPMKSRVPAGLCVIAVWVVGVCVVLPYAVYIKYVDLGLLLGSDFEGVGLCWVNMAKHIQEYIRAMFVVMYCLPLAIMAFLYVKVSAEIKGSESPSVSIHFEENLHSVSEATYQTNVTWSTSESGEHRIDQEGASYESGRLPVSRSRSPRPSCNDNDDDDDIDAELDFRKEKRTQKYMITMVMLFAMCWCPINILTLVTHFVLEDDDNTGHFDVTYLTFAFFGFLSTCINPVLFASWSMSDRTKDRLRGYFRFSNRRQSSSPSAHSTTSTRLTPSPNPALRYASSPRPDIQSPKNLNKTSNSSPRAHVQFVHKNYV